MVSQWTPAEQIAHYAETALTLDLLVKSFDLTPLEAAAELAGAAWVLNCSPPDTGYVAISALLAEEVTSEQHRAPEEWPWIVRGARSALMKLSDA